MKAKYLQLLPILTMLLFASCSSDSKKSGSSFSDLFTANLSEDHIKSALNHQLGSDNDTGNIVNKQLKELYIATENRPVWVSGRRLSDKGKAMIKSIGLLVDDGLDPERYSYSYLAKVSDSKVSNDDSLAALDVLLSKNAILAAKDLVLGFTVPKNIDIDWHAANDTAFSVVAEFSKEWKEDEDALDIFRPQNPRYALQRKNLAKWVALKTDSTYSQLQKSILQTSAHAEVYKLIKLQLSSTAIDSNLIKQYQYLNNTVVSGKIDAALISLLQRPPAYYINILKLNLERLRWLNNSWKSDYIWVSIPQAEVDYYVGNENKFHNPTIVGSKGKQTPSLNKPLQNIVLCPPWNLPHSIVKHDYNGRIPGKYQVFKGGKRVANSMVNSSNYKRFTIRQPAGPSAALGYVKFNLPNEWDIYLHDTPNRSLFENKNRALSHGCVRVKDPQRLAALILEDKGVTADSIAKMISKNQTTAIKTDLIPVYIVYMTIGSDSTLNNLIYLNDIYGKDSMMQSKMKNY